MSDSLNYEIKDDGNTTVLNFSGNIDENSQFPSADEMSPKSLVINLELVDLINSLGIRSWTRWLKEIPSNVVTLKRCPPAIVQQMNIVSGFLPQNAVVESFYIPYYCNHCDTESTLLVERNRDFTPSNSEQDCKINIQTTLPCDNCKETREIDTLEEKYFSFLKRR